MMRRLTVKTTVRWMGVALGGLLVTAATTSTAQQGFVVQQSERIVGATGFVIDCIPTPEGEYCDYFDRQASETDPVGSGPWSATAALDPPYSNIYASQDSLISQSELSGTGTVSANIVNNDNAATSYDVVFDVSATTAYAFDVDNLDPILEGMWPAAGTVTLDQVDPADYDAVVQSIWAVALNPGDPDVLANGVLAPGTYSLHFGLGVGGSATASAVSTASFGLAIIPEPSTGLLAGWGITSLALWRRRRS